MILAKSDVYAEWMWTGTGDIDVLSASGCLMTIIAWYENDGNENFTERINLPPQLMIVHPHVYAADVDGDGDMDVLSASQIVMTPCSLV